ncbi:hypothetical protein CFP56_016761 [Quercus suber]|uniref:Uncharacterized protein n=1 Tax=Quercus suber TaxID=58331 RepID=A0AAW0KMH4_QUESU
MDDFRSKSYGDGRMQQIERYSGVGPTTSSGININSSSNNMQDFRCYSASYATSAHPAETQNQNESKFKKGKSTNGAVSKSWSFNDPELQRKKRVAGYKAKSKGLSERPSGGLKTRAPEPFMAGNGNGSGGIRCYITKGVSLELWSKVGADHSLLNSLDNIVEIFLKSSPNYLY